MRVPDRPIRVCPMSVASMVLLFLTMATAVAQQSAATDEDPAPAETATQPAAPQPALTASELRLQLQQVQEATDLTEEVRSKTEALLTQAIQQLEAAEQWALRAAECDAERKRAPDALRAIQAELAEPLGAAAPEVPAGATRADLEQLLLQIQSELEAEKKVLADWERERDRRTTRRQELRELLTAARARLQLVSESAATPEAELGGVVRRAQRAVDEATRLAVEREIHAYNAELLSFDARRDLLQARVDRSARRIGHLETLVAAWQKVVQARAQQESAAALREAREQLKRAHPAILPLVEERKQLVIRAQELQKEAKEVDARLAAAQALLTEVNQDFEQITRRVNAMGLTNAISQLLRTHRDNLPGLRPYDRSLRDRMDRISSAQLDLMELGERRRELTRVEAVVDDVAQSVDGAASDQQRTMIRETAREAVVALRTELDNLLRDYDHVFEKLVDLDGKERELVDVIRYFDEYVDEKILWVKSGTWPNLEDLRDGRESLAWLTYRTNWKELTGSVDTSFQTRSGRTTLYLILVITLWLASPWFARAIRRVGEKAPKPAQDTMQRTMVALLATAGLAARWPVTLWFVAWLLAARADESEFATAVASGLNLTAVLLLTLQAVRQLARPHGLGEAHFRWNSQSLALLRRYLAWLAIVVVPAFLIMETLESQSSKAAKDSLGRLAFVIAFAAIALFGQRVLRPAGPLLGPILARQKDSWFYRLRHVWYTLGWALPAGLVLAAIAGYYYTANYLGMRFIETIWLLLAVIVVRALIERWLLLQIRHRAITEARARALAKRQQEEAESAPSSEPEAFTVPEDKLDFAAINKQTQRLVQVALLVFAGVALWGIWAETFSALGVLRGVTLWTITTPASETVPTADGGTQVNEYTKTIPITLHNVGLAVLITLLTVVAVKNIPGLLEITILQRLPIDAGGRFAATAIGRYALTVVGVILAFAQIGVGWSRVQWLVAAMTVGLAFGLQEIFANLVSGLMLLFERPIRIGDTVTVGDISGTVTRIRTRATTIVGWDRKELIIPNKEFITGNVVNWTLSDATVRIIVPVGIAYGSDTRLARKLLTRIAHEHPHVLDEPAPRVLFMGFGDSALEFEIRVFIGTLDHYLTTTDELHDAIDREFRKAGIEIAFPQRDVHVRSIHGELPRGGDSLEED